jgi:hypothetical protein
MTLLGSKQLGLIKKIYCFRGLSVALTPVRGGVYVIIFSNDVIYCKKAPKLNKNQGYISGISQAIYDAHRSQINGRHKAHEV